MEIGISGQQLWKYYQKAFPLDCYRLADHFIFLSNVGKIIRENEPELYRKYIDSDMSTEQMFIKLQIKTKIKIYNYIKRYL